MYGILAVYSCGLVIFIIVPTSKKKYLAKLLKINVLLYIYIAI